MFGLWLPVEVEDKREFFLYCVAVMVVPQLLKEGLSSMILGDEGSSYPRLRILSMSEFIPVRWLWRGLLSANTVTLFLALPL